MNYLPIEGVEEWVYEIEAAPLSHHDLRLQEERSFSLGLLGDDGGRLILGRQGFERNPEITHFALPISLFYSRYNVAVIFLEQQLKPVFLDQLGVSEAHISEVFRVKLHLSEVHHLAYALSGARESTQG